MQAIILAAGMGKRLGELTESNTKCMIKVNGVTLIERMLQQLDKEDLERIIIVIGYEGMKLKEYISTLGISTTIEFVENPIYFKTNNIYSLSLAKEKMQEDDTILLESDLIFEDAVLEKLIHASHPSLALVAKFESWMDGTVVTIDEYDNIKRFISTKQFQFEEIPTYYKTVNIYKFSKEFSNTHYIPFLEAYSKALGNNEYYEQVLKVITLLEKPEIKALRLENEDWYEIDDIQDLDIAESVFANEDEKLKKIQNRYGGYWRYPALIDFCYLVNPYFPSEKLKAEMKANFDRLIGEYPSGMSINSLLAAKYFGIKQNYICVGNGAAELIKSLSGYLSGKVGVIFPTFEEYTNRLNDQSLVKFVPQNKDYTYTATDLIDFFSGKLIKSLLLINPDNPSGNFIKKEELFLLMDWTKQNNINFVLDESFVDFSTGFENNSLLSNSILSENQHLIIIKSISKSYGVPGLRLGIIASSNESIIHYIKQDVAIWNINSFAEFYLQIFGKYESEYLNSCKKFTEERERFYESLLTIKSLRVIPSQANYFLCEVLTPFNSTDLTRRLLCHFNILIKDCRNKSGFNNQNYVRIAIRSQEDNLKLYNALIVICHEGY
jgi:histidinol-phosphate/aromatic aminotransferase/cobyric acid decarboxylase-like protein/CTP:phosphocholine cytidylyltransferase-like protein